ncbi:MFS transporter [Spirosoma telluris]|uniref:MFS transporter n=1 Tax=Spirosoma telluris TaxID=2183553 RepID=UPI0038CD1098
MNSPTITAWTADLSDEKTRGRAMATMYIALEAGIGLGALGAGWVLNHIAGEAGIDASFAVSGVLALVAVGYLGWLWQKGPQQMQHQHHIDAADEVALLDGEP